MHAFSQEHMAALRAGWPLLALAFLPCLFLGGPERRGGERPGRGSPRLARLRLGRPLCTAILGGTLLALLLGLFLPLLFLISMTGSWDRLPEAFGANWHGTLKNSLLVAGLAATGALLAGYGIRSTPLVRWSWALFLVPGSLLGFLLAWIGSQAWGWNTLGFLIAALVLRHLCVGASGCAPGGEQRRRPPAGAVPPGGPGLAAAAAAGGPAPGRPLPGGGLVAAVAAAPVGGGAGPVPESSGGGHHGQAGLRTPPLPARPGGGGPLPAAAPGRAASPGAVDPGRPAPVPGRGGACGRARGRRPAPSSRCSWPRAALPSPDPAWAASSRAPRRSGAAAPTPGSS